MKVVEKRIIKALEEGRTATLSCRDRVEGDAVYLWGNCIARIFKGVGIVFNLHGYNTVTTKSRLNAVLSLLNERAHVFQKDYDLFLQLGEKVFALAGKESEYILVSNDTAEEVSEFTYQGEPLRTPLERVA